MSIFATTIYILIGIIGERAVAHKDWATLVSVIAMFVLHVIHAWRQSVKEKEG